MKIVDVDAIVLDTGKDYPDPSQAAEAHGVAVREPAEDHHR